MLGSVMGNPRARCKNQQRQLQQTITNAPPLHHPPPREPRDRVEQRRACISLAATAHMAPS